MTNETTTITKTEYEQLIKDRIELVQQLKQSKVKTQRYELFPINFDGQYVVIDHVLRTFHYISSNLVIACEQPIPESFGEYITPMFDVRNIDADTNPIIVNLFLRIARHNKRLDDIKNAKLAEVEEFKQARINAYKESKV